MVAFLPLEAAPPGRQNGAMSLITEMVRRWPVSRAHVRDFWNTQVRLQQRYIDRHDASGGDALDALMLREWTNAYRAERG